MSGEEDCYDRDEIAEKIKETAVSVFNNAVDTVDYVVEGECFPLEPEMFDGTGDSIYDVVTQHLSSTMSFVERTQETIDQVVRDVVDRFGCCAPLPCACARCGGGGSGHGDTVGTVRSGDEFVMRAEETRVFGLRVVHDGEAKNVNVSDVIKTVENAVQLGGVMLTVLGSPDGCLGISKDAGDEDKCQRRIKLYVKLKAGTTETVKEISFSHEGLRFRPDHFTVVVVST